MFKRIKRRNAAGQWEVIEVPANYVLQEGEELYRDETTPQPPAGMTPQQPTPAHQAVNGLSEETVRRMIEEARAAERSQLTQQLEQSRQAQEALQTRLNAIETERNQAAVNAMTPDARRDHEFQQFRTQLEQAQAQHAQQLQALQHQLLQTDLNGYREHLLRMYGEAIFPEMLVGNSRQELDAAAQRSHQMFNEYRARMEADIVRRYGFSPQQQAPAVGGFLPPPPVPQGQPSYPQQPQVPTITVPANPHYVPPQGYGFPAVVSPSAFVSGGESTEPDISTMTTEDAVRSGAYAQHRQRLLQSIQEGGAPQGVSVGTTPRYSMQHSALPGGAQRPVAAPMAPAANSPQVQAAYPQQVPVQAPQGGVPAYPQVQYAPPVPAPAVVQYPPQQQYAQPSGDEQARAAALESVRRTRDGNNTVISALPGHLQQTALRGVADMRGQHADPRAVYQQTFQNTPPIAAGAPN